jgi:CHAT domain-containing protein/Tfp pilus assembly protein PilF
LRSLASVYDLAGSDYLAEKTYDTLYSIVKLNYDPTSQFSQLVSNEASAFYTTNGVFEKSEIFFLDAVGAMENAYGKESDNYLITYNSLGEFYIYAGWYDKAEKVYANFVTLCAKHYGKKSADHATAINNLAVAYEKQGKNAEAEKCYLEALALKAQVYTKESDFYALTLQNLAVLYDNMARYEEAESLLNEAIGIYEQVYGAEHENYATALNNMSSIYASNARYEKAIRIQQKACNIQKKTIGEKSAGYLNSLGNLAQLYFQKGDLDSAEMMMTMVIEAKKTVLGEDHPDYAVSVYNLGNILTQRGEYRKALDKYNLALGIQEKAGETQRDQYTTTLTSLAGLYYEIGDFVKSEKTYLDCKNLVAKTWGERHPQYAVVVSNLGLLYLETGKLDKAEENMNVAFEILQNAYGINHPDNIYTLTNLAQVYIARSYYEKAENYLLKSIEIARTYYGTDHSNYVSTINTLAAFYAELGQFEKAEKYYTEALAKSKLIYGEIHKEYITTQSNFATLYLSKALYGTIPAEVQRDIDLAEDLLIKALKSDTLAGRQDHPDHAVHLNNLAEVYRNFNVPDLAEKLLLKSVEIEKKAFGENNASVAIGYHNLAMLYTARKDLTKALEFCDLALKIKTSTYGNKSSTLISSLLVRAEIMEKKDDMNEAYAAYKRALTLQIDELNRNLGFLTEEEKEQYFRVNSMISSSYYRFLISENNRSGEMMDFAYDIALKEKGVLLRSSEKMRTVILNSNDQELISLYDQWLGKRQEISRLYGVDQSSRDVGVEVIEAEAASLEKELINRSAEFRNYLSEDISTTGIKQLLGPGEAAIEFIRYVVKDSLAAQEVRYAALILQNGQEHAVLVDLVDEYNLWTMLTSKTGSNLEIATHLYGEMAERNAALFDSIWNPISTHLTQTKTIYFSTVGLIHRISMAALRMPDGTYLSDKFQLHQLTSTGKIQDLKSDAGFASSDKLFVFGGAQFSTQNTESEIWSYLEGTKSEADQIYDLATKSKVSCTRYTGTDASEENFKNISVKSKVEILHIATHGFFYSLDTELETDLTESSTDVAFRGGARGVTSFVKNPNPLMRSGLVLSGANDVWNSTNSNDSLSNEDGVLTSMEVANLNLNDCKLVVLSACETGLGDIHGSEGLYGLQRAFKIAGTDKMIMSLWQVPDKETSEFMVLFYRNLFVDRDVRVAFSKAQGAMRQKYAPYYWAAFILVE